MTGHTAAPGHTLPAAAVGPVSRVLGGADPGYRVISAGGALLARGRAQRLTARFGRAGVLVRSGPVAVGMRLAGYGYGTHLVPVHPVTPAAHANRVSYPGSPLTQWYANGPAGLEQGFTLTAVPGRIARHGPLTLALALSGHARVTAAGAGAVFRRGGSALAYRDLVVTDARGRRLRAWLSLAPGRLLLLRADATRARYPVTVDPIFQQLAKLTASDGAESDNLGVSVAISGDTVVAGAPFATVGSNAGQGAVYVFTAPGGGWADETQAARLTASDGAGGDQLGMSVATNGSTVVAGAPDNGNSGPGAVYVFTEPGGGWADETQRAKLTASDGSADDRLGLSVAMDGRTVVAGAPDANVGGHSQGAAYVFVEFCGWINETQIAKLTASDGALNDELGNGVGISGTTVVAGAPNATIGGHAQQGAAYVFTEPGGGWADETQAAKLTASDGSAGDNLGISAAISQNTVVAGADNATVGSHGGEGAVYVFTEPGGGWSDETQAARLTASDGTGGEAVGYAVAIDSGMVVAGAPNAAIGGNHDQGAVYVFTEPGGGWAAETQTAKLTAADGASPDSLGFSVAVSGTTVAAGAPYATIGGNSQQGAAYVFGPSSSQPPPPRGYRLAGFLSPRRGSRHAAKSVVRVSTYVDYTDGTPVPAWFAAGLAAGCSISALATGAQRLHRHCLRWDPATRRLSYRWRLGRGTGTEILQLTFNYIVSSTIYERITITPARQRRGRRA